MSPQLAQILQAIDQLSSTEQTQVLQHLTHPAKSTTPTKHQATSFYSKAPDILQGVDAQTWVNNQRQE